MSLAGFFVFDANSRVKPCNRALPARQAVTKLISATFSRYRAFNKHHQEKFWKESVASGELPMKAVAANQQPMSSTKPSDADLLRLMAAGDEAAFVRLYKRNQAAVYRFALLMSGAPNIAEEVTQEVFMALIREPHRYDSARGPLSGFLYGVARNHVLRVLQRERHYVQLPDESDDVAGGESLISLTDPFSDCDRHEVIKLVRQAVLSLPPRYREVVVLCDFQELSCTAAAVALDCPVGTLNSRLHRAHSLLLKKLRTRSLGSAANAELKCFA